MRRRLFALLVVGVGCGEPVSLGSEVLWRARHETGDLGEWEAEGRGGPLGQGVEVTNAIARRGDFALRLENPADRTTAATCVFREFADQPEAYYSAWFLLPEMPTTTSGWTLLRLRSLLEIPLEDVLSGEGQGGAGGDGVTTEWRSVFDVGLRSLPDGRGVLYAFGHDRQQLQLPIAVPPPLLAAGRWFHLEVFFHTSPEAEGRLVVWLDGEPVYGVFSQPLGDGHNVSFAVCNAGSSAEDEPSELFVDEVVVSRIRATPAGTF